MTVSASSILHIPHTYTQTHVTSRGACVLWYSSPSLSLFLICFYLSSSAFIVSRSISFIALHWFLFASFFRNPLGRFSGAALTRWGLLRIIARSNRPNGSLSVSTWVLSIYRSMLSLKTNGLPRATDDGGSSGGGSLSLLYTLYTYSQFRRSNGTLTRGGFIAASISFRFYSRFSQLLRRVFVYFPHRSSLPSVFALTFVRRLSSDLRVCLYF